MRRWMCIFEKTLREQLRSPWELALTLLTPPAFVLLYWLFFGSGGSTSYTLLALNQDRGAQGARLIETVGAFA